MLSIGDWVIEDTVPAIVDYRSSGHYFKGRNISNRSWMIHENTELLTLKSLSNFLVHNRYYRLDKDLLKEATIWLLERACVLR